jgi:hypothetical protein
VPAFLVPLFESNDCHNPAGSSAGGEFCSEGPRASLDRAEADTAAHRRKTAVSLNRLRNGTTVTVGRTAWTKTSIGPETWWTSKKGGKTSEQMADDISTFIKAGLIPRTVVAADFPHHDKLQPTVYAADPRGVHIPLDVFVGAVAGGLRPDPAMKISRKTRGDQWDVQLTTGVQVNADRIADAGRNVGAKVLLTRRGDLYVVEVQGLAPNRPPVT